MSVYALWHGGSSYGPSYLADDLEKFESLDAAREAFSERMRAHRFPATFRPVDREPFSVLCPCVEGSCMDIFLGDDDPRESTDPYPDLRLEQGDDNTITESST